MRILYGLKERKLLSDFLLMLGVFAIGKGMKIGVGRWKWGIGEPCPSCKEKESSADIHGGAVVDFIEGGYLRKRVNSLPP